MTALADTAPAPATGGRKGAALDIGLWLAVLVIGAAATTALGRMTLAGGETRPAGLFVRIATPAQMLTLFVVSAVLLRRRGERWASIGLFRPPSIGRVIGLVLAGYAGLIALNGALLVLVFPRIGVAPPNFAALGALQGHPYAYAYWLVLAWVSAALGEELQFRGFLRSRLERLLGGGRWATAGALVGQAAVFGLGHIYQGLSGVIVTGAMGVLLGVMFLAGKRNLIACMVLHGLVDTVSLTLLFLGLAQKGS